MAGMPVVLMLAAVAILAGVVVVALGRGGELKLSRPDSAAYGRRLVTAADMVTFRPPAAFLGYSAPVTDEAVQQMARAVAQRDAELVQLRHELAALRARLVPPGGTARPVPYADPATYADPSAYVNPGSYADLDTTPAYGSAPAYGSPAGYGSPLSFSASREAIAPREAIGPRVAGPPWSQGAAGPPALTAGADASGGLEPYESEPGTPAEAGRPGAEATAAGPAGAGRPGAGQPGPDSPARPAARADAGRDGVSHDYGGPDDGPDLAGPGAEPGPGRPGTAGDAGAAGDAGTAG
jgi:hypothetical protein